MGRTTVRMSLMKTNVQHTEHVKVSIELEQKKKQNKYLSGSSPFIATMTILNIF